MRRNLPSFISEGNHLCDVTMIFPSGGEVIPVVTEYKYLGCVVDELMDLNAMVDDRAEAGRRALGSLLRGVQSAVGVLFGYTFKKLLDSMVQPVLLYGAET